MKKILLFIVLISFFSSCVLNKHANKGIKFQKHTFEDALAIAKKENKLVFIDFWATWCGPCKRMDETVLTDKNIVTFFNKNFINIKLDADSEDAIIPKINYDIRSIPAYVWVDGDGKLLYQYKGTTTVDNFLLLGENALMKFNVESSN